MTEAGAAVISVLVADDHAIVRKGLIELLSRHTGFGRFGEAASVRETLARAQADPWDVILLDLAFPDGSGIDALRDILGRRPDARVIILTMHPEDQLALRMLKAGAMGYLTKESAPEELVKAIRHVLQGGTYLSAAMTQALATGAAVDGGSLPHEQLSTRGDAAARRRQAHQGNRPRAGRFLQNRDHVPRTAATENGDDHQRGAHVLRDPPRPSVGRYAPRPERRGYEHFVGEPRQIPARRIATLR